jgi:hypothetical protein
MENVVHQHHHGQQNYSNDINDDIIVIQMLNLKHQHQIEGKKKNFLLIIANK